MQQTHCSRLNEKNNESLYSLCMIVIFKFLTGMKTKIWQLSAVLVYTTQVNSAFRAHWLTSSEVISQVLFTSKQPKKNKMACYSDCVVKVVDICLAAKNIHHYSPPLWWIIVSYLVILMLMFAFFLQVSAIEQDIIEVDPDTKEMLKVLVSDCSDITCTFSSTKAACKQYIHNFQG